MLYTKGIIMELKSKEEYMTEIKQLHDELGIGIFTGTLIKDESEDLTLRMYEKVALVEFITLMDPQPYKFEDLKVGMWVWDDKEKKCNKIIEIEGRNIDFYYITEDIHRYKVEFEEGRFFPVTKSMEVQDND